MYKHPLNILRVIKGWSIQYNTETTTIGKEIVNLHHQMSNSLYKYKENNKKQKQKPKP